MAAANLWICGRFLLSCPERWRILDKQAGFVLIEPCFWNSIQRNWLKCRDLISCRILQKLHFSLENAHFTSISKLAAAISFEG